MTFHFIKFKQSTSKLRHHGLRVVFAMSFMIVLMAPVAQAAGMYGFDQPDSHGTFRLGIMNFTKSDGVAQYSGSASVLNYEYSRNVKLNQTMVIGYKQATDPKSKRDSYHSTYFGYRLFPMGISHPTFATTGDATINYDSKYKPYGEASIGFGRSLLEAGDDGGEYASDTYGITFGGGLLMHFFTRWEVDFQVMYEMVQGRGGTADSIVVSGSHIYIMFGTGLLF